MLTSNHKVRRFEKRNYTIINDNYYIARNGITHQYVKWTWGDKNVFKNYVFRERTEEFGSCTMWKRLGEEMCAMMKCQFKCRVS